MIQSILNAPENGWPMQVIATEFTEHQKYGKKPSLPVEKRMESWQAFIILKSTVLQCHSSGTVSIPEDHFLSFFFFFNLGLCCCYYSFIHYNHGLFFLSSSVKSGCEM